jgi:hypothetical protein
MSRTDPDVLKSQFPFVAVRSFMLAVVQSSMTVTASSDGEPRLTLFRSMQ